MMLPLAIGAICILTSVAGTYAVKLGENGNIMQALYKGLGVTGILSLFGIAGAIGLTVGFKQHLDLPGAVSPPAICCLAAQ